MKHYLNIALRRLRREKLHSGINIAGLAIGMAIAGLIGLWVWDECTFDRDNPRYDRIARLMQNETANGVTSTSESIPYPLLNELHTTYAGYFKRVVASWWTRDHTLAYRDKRLTQAGKFMEPGAIDLLGLHLLQGSGTALNDPASVIIDASAARTIFGDTDPMGKTITIDGKMTVTVRGVYADLPDNSTFRGVRFIAPFELFTRTEAWVKDLRGDWGFDLMQVYVELADHTDIPTVSAVLRNSTLIHMKDNPEAAGYHPQVFVFPMSRFHLYNEFRDGMNTGGVIRSVWLFGIIGFFVLLLACINFMNLSTARSERRAREVGVRKAIGSKRGQLITQFYCESIVTAIVSFGIALVLIRMSLPTFNQWPKNRSPSGGTTPGFGSPVLDSVC